MTSCTSDVPSRMMTIGIGARGRSRRLRCFAIAFAILQLVLQGTFSVGDGYEQQAASHVAPVHTEVPGNTHHRLHSDDCVICHVLAAAADLPPRATPSWHGGSTRSGIAPASLGGSLHAAFRGARLARAPPVAV